MAITPTGKRVRIFTWHVHGSYLHYLSHIGADIYVPYTEDRRSGYAGLPKGSFPWRSNLHEIPVKEVKKYEFDTVLYQSQMHYLEDKAYLLSPEQQELPEIFLEHDPPRQHPTDTVHVFRNKPGIMVHVTHFNSLMWDTGSTEKTVIEHGVPDPGYLYSGEKERGIAVINNIALRGRRLGSDLWDRFRKALPLDLIGMESQRAGGLGEVPHGRIPQYMASYRFFLNPIRYTSLGLSLVEAMLAGLPVVALATTEIPNVIIDEITGFISTDPNVLEDRMRLLLKYPELAQGIGIKGREYALKRFALSRFVREWEEAITQALLKHSRLPRTRFRYQFKERE